MIMMSNFHNKLKLERIILDAPHMKVVGLSGLTQMGTLEFNTSDHVTTSHVLCS